MKAKESKLEMQRTFVTEFAQVELERKSTANANLLSNVLSNLGSVARQLFSRIKERVRYIFKWLDGSVARQSFSRIKE